MRRILGRFVKANGGATAVEYALFAAIIAGVVIGATGSIRYAMQATFSNVSAGVDTANAP
jgi:Flp pilus assembly pilin Flp